jgi:hypothetical protein
VSSPGIRTKSLAIVWAVILALALGGVVTGLVIVLKDYDAPGGAAAEGAGAANPGSGGTTPPSTAGTGTGIPPTVPGTGTGEGTAEGEDGQKPTTAGPDVVGEVLTVDIVRLLRGYSGETVTYAVGHVTNNSQEVIPALKIDVGLWLSEDGERVGTATAIILNLPPKYTAPVVAECRHNPGVRARYWMLEAWDPSPAGVPRNLPPLETSGAVPLGDPNSVEPTGLIQAQVTNNGEVAVKDMLMYALLLDEKGKIVGAARHRASTKIEPGDSGEVEIEWRHTAGTLVRNVEVWTQPYFYQAER